MSARAYLKSLVAFSLLLSVGVLALNYLIDPYGITGVQRVAGLNKYKTDINNHVRLYKKYHPMFGQYNGLIVGNSRVEMGLNPHHACFVEGGWKVYNLGIPGASVRKQLSYALNVIYQQPVEQIWLTVDFSDFLLTAQERSGGLPTGLREVKRGEMRYLPSGELNPGYLKVRTVDYYKALYSLDAVMSSLQTAAMQNSASADRDELGFNPARDFAHAVAIEGPATLFEQKMSVLEKSFSRELSLRDHKGRLSQSFADVAEFLKIASERGLQVTVVVNPFHRQYWELLARKGLMDAYREWLSEMEVLVSSSPGSGTVFWDFSGQSPFIDEQLPGSGVRSGALKWFWEPAHYREELGGVMTETMLADSCGKRRQFGRQVSH